MKGTDKNAVKAEELLLRNHFNSTVLPKFNSMIQKLDVERSKQFSLCYEKKDASERDECFKKADKDFKDRQDMIRGVLRTFQDELQTCLSSCKSDLSQDIGPCYVTCLKNFRGLADKL